jgi:RND family efflux transporter MFP subunit
MRPGGQDARGGPRGQRGGGPNGAMGGQRGGGFGGRPPAVSLEPIQMAPVVTAVNAVGSGRAKQSVTLNAEVAGVVRRILMKPGADVKKGDALVALVDDAERIALAKARADFAIARTNRERYTRLHKDGAASQLELEASRNEFAAARAALDRAEFDFSRRTIRAPFDGVAGLITLDPGDFVSVGSPVTTIDDVSELLVDFVVPEQSASLIKPGLAFEAILDSDEGKSVKGVIRSVDSRIDIQTRTRRIEAVVENADRALLPGATFAIALSLPSRQIASVPSLAVLYDRAGAYVWRRNAEGGAERVPVTVVRRTDAAALIEGPLDVGDLVVSEGADQVRPGVPLMDASARGADAGAPRPGRAPRQGSAQ